MKKINLSINPSYFCNFRCQNCYLTIDQLSDKTKLSISSIMKKIEDIKEFGFDIGYVDLYGGEPLLLGKQYILDLQYELNIIGCYDINIITNMSIFVDEIINNEDFILSVSYDFDQRPSHEHVFKNMLMTNREFNILTLGTKELFNKDIDKLITQINLLANCVSWEIKPYSTNQANSHYFHYDEFEEFIKKIIVYKDKRFTFTNEQNLNKVLIGKTNSYSDDHLYIAPDGNFKVLDFDINHNEYFRNIPTFNDYLKWCEEEKNKIDKNSYCNSCKYKGICLSEHLKPVMDLKNSCNGFYNLIDWYQKNG